MSNLIDYAKQELERAGLFKKDSDYGGMLGKAVMELITRFSKQGHSGSSANMAVSLFEKVARFEPLIPLTGEDDEWNEVVSGVFQNKRCSHIFKENGQAYDIRGRIFRDVHGITFTNKNSRVSVTFPYTPKSIVVQAEEEN